MSSSIPKTQPFISNQRIKLHPVITTFTYDIRLFLTKTAMSLDRLLDMDALFSYKPFENPVNLFGHNHLFSFRQNIKHHIYLQAL